MIVNTAWQNTRAHAHARTLVRHMKGKPKTNLHNNNIPSKNKSIHPNRFLPWNGGNYGILRGHHEEGQTCRKWRNKHCLGVALFVYADTYL